MIIKTKLIQIEKVSTAILGPLRDFSWTETLVLNRYLYKLGFELSSQESNCLMSFLLAKLEHIKLETLYLNLACRPFDVCSFPS